MLRSAVRPLGIALLVILVFMGLGFRLDHPRYGLSTAMGSAHASLGLYKHGGGEPTVGAKVVVNLVREPNNSPAIGYVRNIDHGKILVDFGNGVRTVSVKDVEGKLIAVVPVLGAIVGIIGL